MHFFWLYYFKMNSKAIVAIGDRPRMQIRDHPFSRSCVPIKSIFLIATKAMANRSHRGRNCPYAGLKFKSLFYKGKKFSFSFKPRGTSRRTKGKRKHSKKRFQKKVLVREIQCEGKRISSLSCRNFKFHHDFPERNIFKFRSLIEELVK